MDEIAERTTQPRIKSLARATDVLIAIAASPTGLRAKEICERTDLSLPGTYHLLQTLSVLDLVTRTGDGSYVMGLRIGTLAAAFSRQMAPAEHLATRVRLLAEATGETAYAAGWQAGEIVVLTTAQGTNPVQARQIVPGSADDGHARASGKLLLAYATTEQRADYLRRHPLRARTDATIVERAELEDELQIIRTRGFAIDKEEFSVGLACLAVPLDGGASPYVLGVSCPVDRFKEACQRYLQIAHDIAGANYAA